MISLNEWVKLWNNGWFNTKDRIKFNIGGWNNCSYTPDRMRRLTEMYSRILVRIKTDREVPVSFDINEIYLGQNVTIKISAHYEVYINNLLVKECRYYREVVKYINEII